MTTEPATLPENDPPKPKESTTLVAAVAVGAFALEQAHEFNQRIIKMRNNLNQLVDIRDFPERPEFEATLASFQALRDELVSIGARMATLAAKGQLGPPTPETP